MGVTCASRGVGSELWTDDPAHEFADSTVALRKGAPSLLEAIAIRRFVRMAARSDSSMLPSSIAEKASFSAFRPAS